MIFASKNTSFTRLTVLLILALVCNVFAAPASRETLGRSDGFHEVNEASSSSSLNTALSSIPEDIEKYISHSHSEIEEVIEDVQEPHKPKTLSGRKFLLETYRDHWEEWTQHFAKLYLDELRQMNVPIGEDVAYNHIFTGIDATLASALVSNDREESTKAAKEFYEKSTEGAGYSISIADLLPKTWSAKAGKRHT